MKKNRKILSIIGIVIALVIVLVAIVARNSSSKEDSITFTQSGETVTVNRGGRVEFVGADGAVRVEQWSDDKVSAFYSYFSENYEGVGVESEAGEGTVTLLFGGESTSYSLGDGDELVDEVINDMEEGSGGPGGDGGGDDVSDIFDPSPSGSSSPTPTPTPPGSGGGTGGGSGGGSGSGGSGGSGGDPECLYWKLSYCARFPDPTPTPTPPAAEGGVFNPDCTENTFTGRTVITNELCVTEPTQ